MRSVDPRNLTLHDDVWSASPFEDQNWPFGSAGMVPGVGYTVARPNSAPSVNGAAHPAAVDGTGNDGLMLIGAIGSNSTTNGGTTGSAGSGTSLSSISSSSASPFVIHITWDSSVGSAPSGFQTAVLNAVQYLEANYTDAVTININVGFGEVGGTVLGSNDLGESITSLASLGYSTLYNAMKVDSTTASDATAVASLPSTAPINGGFAVTTAQAKALGLMSATGTAADGSVGFSNTLGFTYNDSSGVATGTYDFNAVVLHEISEVMGRILLTGNTLGTTTNYYDPFDLFHYSASGIRDFSASTAGYFSIDSGNTNLHLFNTQSGGDAGDWASSATRDAADAFATSGVVEPFSNADQTALDVIGWNRVSATPTGVAVAAATSSLATAQGSGGLSANVPLARVTQIGGNSADSFTYTLGGTDAASFGLTSAGNVATLSAGASGVAGATNGQLYALTMTAGDTTTGNSSSASPLDVIVGGSGNDFVSAATLSGSLGLATPTLVYGLAGNDTISGTNMTGKLWLDGGAGADTMTGGSGVNDYLYSAASDSTGSAVDIITNFHASMDVIDLTGLGTALKYAGKIYSTSLSADSVGWKTSGGNTFVYVNTSGASEALSATSMKIELKGGVSLSGSNILHA